MEEVWKTIPGLRFYEASDLGHIRRIGATKPLKGSCNKELAYGKESIDPYHQQGVF